MSKRSKIAWILCAIATVLLGIWFYTDHPAAIAVAFVVLVHAYVLFTREISRSQAQTD